MDELTIIIPGIATILVLLVYYLSQPRLPIRINRAFLGILIAELFVMLTEGAAIYVNVRFQTSNMRELLYAANTLFLLTHIARSYLFFIFSSMTVKVYITKRSLRWLVRTPMIITMALLLSTYQFGTVFSIDRKFGYTDGPLYWITPACLLVYVAISVCIIISKRQRISEPELYGALGFNAILIIGSVLRIYAPHSLTVNLFTSLAVIIGYLSFENPGFYLSDRGGVFNKRAMKAVLEECIGNNSTYRALGFVLRGYMEERRIYGSSQIDRGITMISYYLKNKYPKHLIFYLRNGHFVIFDKEALNIFRIREELSERFRDTWKTRDTDLFLSVSFVKIGAESNIKSADVVIDNLIIALEKIGGSAITDNEMLDLDNTNEIDEVVKIKGALEYAVDNDLVEVFLQPIISASTGQTIGAEALARIRDEEGKIISPAQFIPIAEKSGYINMLGEQVFTKTCQFVNSNSFSKTGIKFVNVNLSPIQCMRSDLSERFIAIMRKYKAEPERIHLEITEQSMGDFDAIVKQVDNLKRAGFRFSLDDFGSGYSNLTRLKYYPFFNVKLDMDVVRDYCSNGGPFVPNLMNALKQMGYTITAEGIETKEMADKMKAIGCDYLQGYLYSKPLPTEEFVLKYSRIF